MFDPVGTEEKHGFAAATSDAFDMFQSILKIKMITVHVNGNEMAWVCENHFGIRTCPNGVLRLLARQLRCTETNFGGRKDMKVASKDDKNLQKVLDKIAKMDEPARSVMHRMHDVIVSAAPELKPRIWYGVPGYAKAASSPILVFFRKEELMTLGVSEKATLKVASGKDGRLIPCRLVLRRLGRRHRAACGRDRPRRDRVTDCRPFL